MAEPLPPPLSATPAAAPPVLEIEDLCVSYRTRGGDVPAVVNFSLRLDAGETVGLVGESGCGKSTIAFAILRYLGRAGRISGGAVRFKGRDLVTLDRSELRRLRGAEIAMVYQEPMSALNPAMTIGAQLAEVPILHERVGRSAALERAAEMLEAVRLPEPGRILAAYPHQISGGQQQRVVIAMALLARPALLLLDEPTTALDVTVEAGIVELIAELGGRFGTANLFISHNLGLIRATCDRVAVMYSGQVAEEGRVADVFRRMRHPYTRGLFAAIPLPAFDKRQRSLRAIRGSLPSPVSRPRGCFFGPRCDHFIGGRCDAGPVPIAAAAGGAVPHLVRCVRHAELPAAMAETGAPAAVAAEIGAEVLSIDALRKEYVVGAGALDRRRRRVIAANDGVTLNARRGETVAIVGESGCGKSTLAKVLLGLETASGGTVRFLGDEIGDRDVGGRSAEQLGAMQMVFQNPQGTLNPSRSVGAQIARAVRKLGSTVNEEQVRRRVGSLLRMVKLPADVAGHRPRQLSGGQKQRIAIARAFAGTPALVVADEPVSALDVSVQAAVTELLMDVQREHGTTLLFISHDLSVVRYLADRVAVMYFGRIVEQGSTDQVFAPPYHPYTEALLAAVPLADPTPAKRRVVLEGALPSPLDPPRGCAFASRCPRKLGAICENEAPAAQPAGPGHSIACHIPMRELDAVPPVFRVVTAAE